MIKICILEGNALIHKQPIYRHFFFQVPWSTFHISFHIFFIHISSTFPDPPSPHISMQVWVIIILCYFNYYYHYYFWIEVVQAGKDVSYFGVILIGFAVTGMTALKPKSQKNQNRRIWPVFEVQYAKKMKEGWGHLIMSSFIWAISYISKKEAKI